MKDENARILDELFKNQSPRASVKIEADEIILIVDRSGSMGSIARTAQDGINNFVDEQKKQGVANLTLVQFDDRIEPVYTQVDVQTVETYRLIPRDNTALFDAVGKTLANAESIQTTGKKIVVIVTDGFENASREWTREGVFARIEQLKEAGWSFLFLAANQDALGAGTSIGVRGGSTIQYAADQFGTQAVYMAASNYTSGLRSGLSLDAVEAKLTETISSTVGLSRSDINHGAAVPQTPNLVAQGAGVAGPFVPGQVDQFAHRPWPAINEDDAEDSGK